MLIYIQACYLAKKLKLKKMKNSTNFFIVGCLFLLAFVGMILFPGETTSQATASLFIADAMALIGLACMWFYKREHALGR